MGKKHTIALKQLGNKSKVHLWYFFFLTETSKLFKDILQMLKYMGVNWVNNILCMILCRKLAHDAYTCHVPYKYQENFIVALFFIHYVYADVFQLYSNKFLEYLKLYLNCQKTTVNTAVVNAKMGQVFEKIH